MLHLVERSIDMEIELGDDSELILLQIAELEANRTLIFLHLLEHSLSAVRREDAQIYVGDAQVGRHAHLAYGDEQVADTLGIAKEDVAEVLLHEAGDLLLSSSLHDSQLIVDG